PRAKNHGCHGHTDEMAGVPLTSHWSETGLVVSGVLATSMRSILSDRMSREATSAARLGSDWLSRTRISTGWVVPCMARPLPTALRTPPMTKLSASPKPASGPVCGLTYPILIDRPCARAGRGRSPPTPTAAAAPDATRKKSRRATTLSSAIDSSCALELNRRGRHLAARIELRQSRRGVLPHEQHRALRREPAVTDVRGHGGDVARLHRHPRAHGAGLAVLDLPLDLVAELHEPLDAVVAVDDRQDVLLRRRAVEARLADGDDRGVPGHVGAGEVGEQVEADHLVLEARLGHDLGLVLGDVAEVAVYGEAGLVAARRLVAGRADHPLGGDAVAGDRLLVAAVLGAE